MEPIHKTLKVTKTRVPKPVSMLYYYGDEINYNCHHNGIFSSKKKYTKSQNKIKKFKKHENLKVFSSNELVLNILLS